MGNPSAVNGRAAGVDLMAYKRDQYNVLVPTSHLQQISPFHQLRVEEVKINPDPAAGDVFKVGSTKVAAGWQDVLALSKTALLKLAAAAGIVWNWHDTRVITASRDYVLYQAVGALRKSSGEWIPIKATKEIDLSVIEEELRQPNKDGVVPEEPKVTAAMIQWRKNKLMRAETGAMLRVIRALLSIKHQYSPAELARPFIVPRVDFAPDPTDPAVRQLLLEQGARAMVELFGPSPAPTAPSLPPAQAVAEYRQALASGIEVHEGTQEETEPPVVLPEPLPPAPAPSPPAVIEPAPEASDAPPCDVCGKVLSTREVDYSLSKYGRPLCYGCQRKGAKP